MTNIELLELISKKIDVVRDTINNLSLKVVKDDNYDLVFDAIVNVTSDLDNASATAKIVAEEIDTIEI
jgi:broad specificity phosphatase PhoE